MKAELGKILGETIAAERARAGLTQEELAARVGIAARSLQNLESGKDMPRYTTLFKLAQTLECEPGQLLSPAWHQWRSKQSS